VRAVAQITSVLLTAQQELAAYTGQSAPDMVEPLRFRDGAQSLVQQPRANRDMTACDGVS
jgi:hypothetical protein